MTAKRGDSFNLDAARAARREAVGESFKFVWNGEDFVCLAAKEWPVQVSAVMSEGNLVEGLRLILGDEQHERFMLGKPSMGDVEALMEALAKFSGVNTSGE